MLRTFAAICSVSCALMACSPRDLRVVDAASGAGISNAKVTVWEYSEDNLFSFLQGLPPGDGCVGRSWRTDADGRVRVYLRAEAQHVTATHIEYTQRELPIAAVNMDRETIISLTIDLLMAKTHDGR